MTFWKGQKYTDSNKISSCRGLGDTGGDEQVTGTDVSGSEVLLGSTAVVAAGHHTCPHLGSRTQRGSLNINYRLHGRIRGQC